VALFRDREGLKRVYHIWSAFVTNP